MKSFGITVAFVLAAISAGVGALPTGSETLARRDGNFFFPIWRPYTPYAPPPRGAIDASGANGGTNNGGNGANGGTISINSREDNVEETEQILPFWPGYYMPAGSNGAITASGANGGYNYGGSGANGGSIAINGRDEHVSLPVYRGSQNSVSGQNTGVNTGSVGTLSGGGFSNSVSGYNGGVNSGTIGAMYGGGYLNRVNGVNTGTNTGSIGTSSGGGSRNSVNGMNSGFNSGTVGSISN